jgi:hypothetical protein
MEVPPLPDQVEVARTVLGFRRGSMSMLVTRWSPSR